MIERKDQTRDLSARKILESYSRPTLTEEFALRMNDFLRFVPDNTPLATYFGDLEQMVAYRTNKEGIIFSKPSQEWIEYTKTLSKTEKAQITRLIRSACGLNDMRYFRDMRKFSEKEGLALGIGIRGKAFAHTAFRRDESLQVETREKIQVSQNTPFFVRDC